MRQLYFNDYRTTVTKIHTAIREIGNLRGIYMANLSVTGCAQAILEAGKKGQIHLVCHDINEGVRQLLKEGLVDFTIPQDFVYQGSEPLLLLAHYLRRNELPKQDPAAGAIQVLCAENMN